MLVDTHTHLTDPRFADDLDSVITRAVAAGVEKMVVCGYDVASSRSAVELAGRYDSLWATAGVHPHDASTCDDAAMQTIRRLCDQRRVVAVGETGLDFHYNHSLRQDQFRAFRSHIELAIEVEKPLIVHSRSAMPETLGVLREFTGQLPNTVLHCFSGDENDLGDVLGLGCWIGIDGPITFPSSNSLRQLIASCPKDRLLLETDCPYMAPMPFRGKRNEPAYLTNIARIVAEQWAVTDVQAAEITTANANAFLKNALKEAWNVKE